MMNVPAEPLGDELPRKGVTVPSRVGGLQGDWRIERARLIQQHSGSVRRRKRRYASFAQTSFMVQNLGLKSKEEWLEFMEYGEFRSPYVPSDPEAYYGPRREWLGWRCWLTGEMGGDEGTQDA